MILASVIHAVAAWIDVWYAAARRNFSPVEQHMHSLLDMLPLAAMALLANAYWDQFLALFGADAVVADFSLRDKADPLPAIYVACPVLKVPLHGPHLDTRASFTRVNRTHNLYCPCISQDIVRSTAATFSQRRRRRSFVPRRILVPLLHRQSVSVRIAQCRRFFGVERRDGTWTFFGVSSCAARKSSFQRRAAKLPSIERKTLLAKSVSPPRAVTQ